MVRSFPNSVLDNCASETLAGAGQVCDRGIRERTILCIRLSKSYLRAFEFLNLTAGLNSVVD